MRTIVVEGLAPPADLMKELRWRAQRQDTNYVGIHKPCRKSMNKRYRQSAHGKMILALKARRYYSSQKGRIVKRQKDRRYHQQWRAKCHAAAHTLGFTGNDVKWLRQRRAVLRDLLTRFAPHLLPMIGETTQ